MFLNVAGNEPTQECSTESCHEQCTSSSSSSSSSSSVNTNYIEDTSSSNSG